MTPPDRPRTRLLDRLHARGQHRRGLRRPHRPPRGARLDPRCPDRRLRPPQPRALHRPRPLGPPHRLGPQRPLTRRPRANGRHPRRLARAAHRPQPRLRRARPRTLRRRPRLGHWYLVTPRLPARPLVEITTAFLIVVIIQGILFAVSLAVSVDDPVGGRDRALSSDPTFWLRIVIGFGLTLLFGWMAWTTARMRSMMAATGLLYLTTRRPRRPDRCPSPHARQWPPAVTPRRPQLKPREKEHRHTRACRGYLAKRGKDIKREHLKIAATGAAMTSIKKSSAYSTTSC